MLISCDGKKTIPCYFLLLQRMIWFSHGHGNIFIFPRSWVNFIRMNAAHVVRWRPRAQMKNVRNLRSAAETLVLVSVVVLCCWTDIWQQNVEKCYIMAYKCDKLPIQHIFRRKEADIHVSCVSVNQNPIDNDLNRVYVLWTEGTDPHTRSSRRTMHGKTLPSTVVSKPRLPPRQCVCMSQFDV